ncbi:MAG: LysM peptidoglycan-binding domain-containing protein [Bacillota bacterium]
MSPPEKEDCRTNAPKAECGFLHVVRPGENLFLIGERYGLSWQEIAAANPGLRSPYGIVPGQRLVVPVLAHVVRPGETLYRLARYYRLDWEVLAAANDLPSPFLIYPGQVLAVPRPCAYEPPAPSRPAEEGPPEAPSLPCGLVYTVQKGDTLRSIAERFELPLSCLLSANPHLAEASPLAVGQRLVIPRRVILHKVGEGETLYSLAQRYGVSVELLAWANDLRPPFTVYLGEFLIVLVPCIPPAPPS